MDSWLETLWATIVGNAVWRVVVFLVGVGVPALLGWLIGWATHRKPMNELRERIAELEAAKDGDDTTHKMSDTVDFIDATAIVNAYVEPALVGKRAIVKISVTRDLLDRFGETTGAKVSEYEYNRALLHQWIRTNAAKFLVKYRGEMT